MPGNTYTWKEVAKHNTPKDAWIAVEGKVYDITEFIDKHPGGEEYLRIAAGRDCTDLFKSYHPFTSKPSSILPKYEIGTISTIEHNIFKPDSGFYKDCCEKVKEYFDKNNLNPKNPINGLWRLAIFLTLLGLSYYTLVSNASYPIKFLAAIVFGCAQALCLVHQMHDASHSSIGNSPIWWKTIGKLTMDWISGASITSWHHQHVLGHHVYTNIMGADPDMPMFEDGDLRYLVNRQMTKSLYKYQHIYMPILYGLLAIKFRIQDFTWTYASELNGPIRVNPLKTSQWVELIASKSFWVFYRIVIPTVYFGLSLKEVLLFFFVTELTTGYYLAFNFQVSHVSTEAFFPASDKALQEIKEEWAVVQVAGSVDYAHDSPMAAFLSGALNYQTVHHLFPGVSQYYYPAIAPIIKKVCEKHKVPFNHIPTFREALILHIKYLYIKGQECVNAK